MTIFEHLMSYQCALRTGIKEYDNTIPISKHYFPQTQVSEIECSRTLWECRCHSMYDHTEDLLKLDLNIAFKVVKGNAIQSSVAAEFEFTDWSSDNYVLIPGAVYNGNRFESRPMPYPPLFEDPKDIGKDIPTIISDVPRLNNKPGPSELHLTTGDMATPAIGFFDPNKQIGFFLLTTQGTDFGLHGINIQENSDRSRAIITLDSPCIREKYTYIHNSTKGISQDSAADFKEGDIIELPCSIYVFSCPDLMHFFETFTMIRKSIIKNTKLVHSIPFSAAWDILEERYNRECWRETNEYYVGGMGDGNDHDWQIGWVGGGMSTYALIAQNDPLSLFRSKKTLDFVFTSQTESGFFHGCNFDGKWVEDGLGKDHSQTWHLIRKSSDTLYFLLKQILLLESQQSDFTIPDHWKSGVKNLADAFIRLWKRYGQLGQFVDVYTAEMIIGGSASAGIAPAGLALAGTYFNNSEYLESAAAIADYYYDNYVRSGLTNGGPGEILQCPDSESAFGLLESFIVLYEETGEEPWLEKAKDAANQCITWCVSYDFEWPCTSEFARLNMRTTGSVIANSQNKHSSPGICTLSGNSLFKLYRETGDKKYLSIIQEIAHNHPQYLSTADRPILAWDNRALPSGWMCERVNMSDWEGPDKVGGVFYGSTWSEVSNMLTITEIPGLYVQPDTSFVCAFDHISILSQQTTEEGFEVIVTNPTEYEAAVSVFVENSSDMSYALGQNYHLEFRSIILKPRGSTLLTFPYGGKEYKTGKSFSQEPVEIA